MKVKVNILSSGRFQLCDLARELDSQGFDVKFYSYVPYKRAKEFGLPKRCSSSLYYLLVPILALEFKLFPGHPSCFYPIRKKIQDFLTSIFMRKADITFVLTGNFVWSIKKAKRLGSIIVLEQVTKNIKEKNTILKEISRHCDIQMVYPGDIVIEEMNYQQADVISVPAEHVKNSFLLQGFPKEKIFVNPYGVDLSLFRYVPGTEKKYDIIFVGNWCYRKGCDLILEAVLQRGYSFLQIGKGSDMPVPSGKNITHIDRVDLKELYFYLNQAKVFVLPSREEGLALVQAEAIACNLPLVGSIDSGALDLKRLLNNTEFINCITEYDVKSLINNIDMSLEQVKSVPPNGYAGEYLDNLSWKAYGKRHAELIHSLLIKD